MLVTAGYFNYSANSEHNVVETVSEESLDLNEDKDEDEIHKGVLEEETVEEEEPGFEEAKYMLVVCSAFINYIQGKKAKA